MEAPSFSEEQVRAAAQAFAEVQADLAVQRARLRSDIQALLTPEQQQLQCKRSERLGRRSAGSECSSADRGSRVANL
jgi:Spy/CpxP family protein refolding chaperone